MNILSFKSGHDGQIAYIKNEMLEFSIEAEKDSWPRYAYLSPSHYLAALQYVNTVPDVIAVSGWVKDQFSTEAPIEGGYFGESTNSVMIRKQMLMGKNIEIFSSSHERSHLLCSYGLSPFQQGHPCYALVWEGGIGAFYRFDEQVRIEKIGEVTQGPGSKYQFLYSLADPTFPDSSYLRPEDAGKLMALVSYGVSGIPNSREAEVIEYILSGSVNPYTMKKSDLRHSEFYNIGVESEPFKRLARLFSDALFDKFNQFAKRNLTEGLPLLISGGCGLNCDWNTAWVESGLFSDVFVPPCTNDSGAAIGTAIDAQLHFSGNAKISWSPYAGEQFQMDISDMTRLKSRKLELRELCEFLHEGNIIAWVQGRYEIGPRALGNRSILAMPFSAGIHSRLNAIKNREGFRPIAPVCLEEDISLHFYSHGPSPYMLYFQKVKNSDLPAITHVDGSARVQSVNQAQNPKLHALLSAFKSLTGIGILCNTSLNFKGAGFINRMSDLVTYARTSGLDGFVVEDVFYTFEK